MEIELQAMSCVCSADNLVHSKSAHFANFLLRPKFILTYLFDGLPQSRDKIEDNLDNDRSILALTTASANDTFFSMSPVSIPEAPLYCALHVWLQKNIMTTLIVEESWL